MTLWSTDSTSQYQQNALQPRLLSVPAEIRFTSRPHAFCGAASAVFSARIPLSPFSTGSNAWLFSEGLVPPSPPQCPPRVSLNRGGSFACTRQCPLAHAQECAVRKVKGYC